ncbi:hypothetical protein RJ640_025442 [Escallonia rubra]|uniref:Integrase catalytic domain-containing protein n=1 Tax=Escallonia rubra TaxID=112253 RepID=A0AA88S8A6_9ASTE|nr:hypothetical protein RJ640_025442 [Escallonia rubra]
MTQDIVSDRDSCFIGNFWTELFKLFGSQLSMSSSYHPESDGQIERFNSMLEEYLCHFVNATQKNWVKLLDVAQLCFNSCKSSSTGKRAFEIMNVDPSRGEIKRPGLKPKAARKRVVESILNDRVITASHKRHQEYLVKWQGYTEEENT